MSVKQSRKRFAVRVDHDFLEACYENENITKKSYRVLFYLLTKADSKHFVEVSQKEIANNLNMDKASISLAVKNLSNEGIIQSFPYSSQFMFTDMDDEEEEEYM